MEAEIIGKPLCVVMVSHSALAFVGFSLVLSEVRPRRIVAILSVEVAVIACLVSKFVF